MGWDGHGDVAWVEWTRWIGCTPSAFNPIHSNRFSPRSPVHPVQPTQSTEPNASNPLDQVQYTESISHSPLHRGQSKKCSPPSPVQSSPPSAIHPVQPTECSPPCPSGHESISTSLRMMLLMWICVGWCVVVVCGGVAWCGYALHDAAFALVTITAHLMHVVNHCIIL